MKRRIIRLMLIGLTVFAITGCENLSEVIPPDQTAEIEDTDEEADEAEDDEDQLTTDAGETTGIERTVVVPSATSDIIYLYDPESEGLTRIDRRELAKGESESDSKIYHIYDTEPVIRSFVIGEGDGFLFFRDTVNENGESHGMVYAVREEDGKIYEIWRGTGNSYMSTCEYYKGRMYIDYVIGYDESYKSLGDDTVSFEYDKKSDSFVEKDVDPAIDTILAAALKSDAHLRKSGNLSSAHVYDECGYLPAYMDGELVLINSQGSIRQTAGLSDGYDSYYDENHIFTVLMDYEKGTGKAYVYDIKSEELTEISDERGADKLLGKEGKKYYYNVPGQEEYGIKHNYIYEYDSETGLIRFIYDEKSTPGSSLQPGIEGFSVTDKYIFYIGFENGDTFWKTVKIDDPGLPFVRYDISRDPVFDYGTVSYMSTTVKCPDCGTDLVCTYNEYLVLDDHVTNFADTINDYLYENALGFVTAENTEISDSPCEDHKEHPTWYRITNDYYVSGVHEICGHFLTVDMSGYWYGGGAHGYPYRDQYLFDLDTGEALTITDFYEGSETEFKTLIAEKTEEDFYSYDLEDYGSPYFASEGGDVYEQAYEYASLDSGTIDFTEDGIIYYYPPYDMGPYASGFIEIFVPYDELLGRKSL